MDGKEKSINGNQFRNTPKADTEERFYSTRDHEKWKGIIEKTDAGSVAG